MRRAWRMLVPGLFLGLTMTQCGGSPEILTTCNEPISGMIKTARVSVKVILDENGNRPTGVYSTNAEITRALTDADNALIDIGANWRLDLAEIVDAAGISQWLLMSCNDEPALDSAAQSDPTLYKWRQDAINIYVIAHLDQCGGVGPLPGGESSTIVIESERGILNGGIGWLHEIGHFFGLIHTDDDSGNCIGGGGMDELCVDTCPDNFNVMSRKTGITPDSAALSPCQRCIVAQYMDPLTGSRRNVIEP